MLKFRARRSHSTIEIEPIVQLWALRILVDLNVHREFMDPQGVNHNTLATLLGFDSSCSDFDVSAAREQLRHMLLKAEKRSASTSIADTLHSNVSRLAKLVGLNTSECRILEFAIAIRAEAFLDDIADGLGLLSSLKLFRVLAVILDLPVEEVSQALSHHGLLLQSGLLTVDHSPSCTLGAKLDLLSYEFAELMLASEADPRSFLRGIVSPASSAELSLAHYPHIQTSLAILQPYLSAAMANGRRGVNILLHGEAGTGKSQLARALAADLHCQLYEVASENSRGDPIDGEQRLRSFRAAQCFFARHSAMIVFDEVEDVFNDGDGLFGLNSTARKRKAWLNRMLEENTLPTMWLSNSIDGMDRAFIRRFDMVIELPIPSKGQRERILSEECSDLVDVSTITRLAKTDSLAPALVTRAASVLRSIRDKIGNENCASALELLIDNTLIAQRHRSIRSKDGSRLPEIYDPFFIHADADLASIAAGIVQSKSARLCLYGPPGTGKTAFAHWLAGQLDAPLFVKRASDLVAPFLGETEQNIAGAFQAADRDGAILLIDEVDSFLQDRRGAQRNWEVSQVNEMLTQIEAFSGIFIASTNLMAGLDQAALRRFDLKVKFDFLKRDQAKELLRRYCLQLSITAPTEHQLLQFSRLNMLSPGDFAAVIRQSRFRPIASASELILALEAECALKEGTRVPIGF